MHARLLLCPRNFDAQNILLGKWPAIVSLSLHVLIAKKSQEFLIP